MATNRETARDALATLLTSALTGSGKPAQAVYNHKTGDFENQSPVVLVMSAGSQRGELTYSPEFDNVFYLVVEVWVLRSDPDAGWTEAEAEDRLDLIEAEIAEVLASNYSHSSGTWDKIIFDGRTQVIEVVLSGTAYLVEIIPVRVEKDDT